MYDTVKDALNGQGRKIVYTAFAKTINGFFDPTNKEGNAINSLMEGNFVNGDLNGFGRNIYLGKSDDVFKCKYGFFKNNDLDGKGIYYTAGQTNVTQGIWKDGGETPSDPSVVIKDFIYWK